MTIPKSKLSKLAILDQQFLVQHKRQLASITLSLRLLMVVHTISYYSRLSQPPNYQMPKEINLWDDEANIKVETPVLSSASMQEVTFRFRNKLQIMRQVPCVCLTYGHRKG